MSPGNPFYGDAMTRYRCDAGFATLVQAIYAAGISQGFTPGELRDAAFVAAVKLEQEQLRPAGFSSPAARPVGDR